MNNPKQVKVGDKIYKLNTDFRVALKCVKVAQDKNIGNHEKALALIYLLYGEEGLNNSKDYEQLLRLATKYLACNREVKKTNDKRDMDFEQDWIYIKASFMSDYHIDLDSVQMHWWDFQGLMNGLSNSEMGNCCILNRIRNIRTMDLSEIKNPKTKNKLVELKKEFALKQEEKEPTQQQGENALRFFKEMGLYKGE